MSVLYDIKLSNYDEEDISDVIVKLEKSFGIKFSKTAFTNVKTFGELCDVIEIYINKYSTKDDCTKQQAFYKTRNAISVVQSIDEKQINLSNKLRDIFPRHNRRKQTKKFQKQLGVRINILTYPGWLAIIIGIGFIISLVAFFIDWRIAISGIIFFILTLKLAELLGKELDSETVQQLTEKIVIEHYVEIRRERLTVNRKEILEIIKKAFSKDLSINESELTRETSFQWDNS
jgi:acyl carrier protein